MTPETAAKHLEHANGHGYGHLIDAIEAENIAKYGENWREAMDRENDWRMFAYFMRFLGPLALVEWAFVRLCIVALPGWTLFANLGMAAAISALFVKILRRMQK